MRVLDLTMKDLAHLVRDWKTALFLFAMPMIFTLLFGFVFSGGGDDPRLPVGVLDMDENGALSARLVELMRASDVIRPVVTGDSDTEALAGQVADGDLAAAVIVPAGYSADVLAGASPPLRVIVDAESEAGVTIETNVRAVANRLLSAVQSARLTVKALAETAPDRYADAFAREAALQDAMNTAIAAWEDPPFTVKEASTGETAEGEFAGSSFAHSSAGMMAQFAIAGLIGAAEIIVTERKTRTLQRLLTTTLSRAQVISGHFLAIYVMVVLQLSILAVFGQLVFDVRYFNAPGATLVMIGAFAFFTAALGMLIGAVAKTEDQVVIFAMLPMFVLSALGGAWVPLEFTGETFQTIGHFTPLAWAIDGLKNITVRGLGLNAVLQPSLILLGFGALCFIVAVWQFHVE